MDLWRIQGGNLSVSPLCDVSVCLSVSSVSVSLSLPLSVCLSVCLSLLPCKQNLLILPPISEEKRGENIEVLLVGCISFLPLSLSLSLSLPPSLPPSAFPCTSSLFLCPSPFSPPLPFLSWGHSLPPKQYNAQSFWFVVHQAIVFRPFKGEVLDAVVTQVNKVKQVSVFHVQLCVFTVVDARQLLASGKCIIPPPSPPLGPPHHSWWDLTTGSQTKLGSRPNLFFWVVYFGFRFSWS